MKKEMQMVQVDGPLEMLEILENKETDFVDKIIQLAELKEKGLLSEDQYECQKDILLRY